MLRHRRDHRDERSPAPASSPSTRRRQRLYIISNGSSSVYGFQRLRDEHPNAHAARWGNFPFAVGGAASTRPRRRRPEGHIYYLGEGPGLFGFNSSGARSAAASRSPAAISQIPAVTRSTRPATSGSREYGGRKVTGFTSPAPRSGARSTSAERESLRHRIGPRATMTSTSAATTAAVYRFDAADGYATAHLVDSGRYQDMAFDATDRRPLHRPPGQITPTTKKAACWSDSAAKAKASGARLLRRRGRRRTGVVYASDSRRRQDRRVPRRRRPRRDHRRTDRQRRSQRHGRPGRRRHGDQLQSRNTGPTTAYGETASCNRPRLLRRDADDPRRPDRPEPASTPTTTRSSRATQTATNQGLDETITPHFVSRAADRTGDRDHPRLRRHCRASPKATAKTPNTTSNTGPLRANGPRPRTKTAGASDRSRHPSNRSAG